MVSSTSKSVAVIQSCYVPWKGYFDIIGRVDLFIFHDDLQYTKDDWRNRNRIKTARGLEWLTIPCGRDEKRRIDEVRVDTLPWQREHWARIERAYRSAQHWDAMHPLLAPFWIERTWTHLSELNHAIITALSRQVFGFPTRFAPGVEDAVLKKVHELVKKTGGTVPRPVKK